MTGGTEMDILDPAPKTEVAVVDAPGELLGFIARAVSDPAVDVTKLKALLDMKRDVEADAARRDFIEAYARLSAKLPRVKKNGTIELGKDDKGKARGSIPFARWEDIDKVIRPVMADEGFTLSFDTTMRDGQGGGLVVHGELMHVHGHTRRASMPLSLDTGPGRNNLQAMGSTLSYGRRYVAEMLLNIVREGDDDDGVRGGMKFITKEQVSELEQLLQAAKRDRLRFLQMFELAELENMSVDAFPAARNMLLLAGRAKASENP